MHLCKIRMYKNIQNDIILKKKHEIELWLQYLRNKVNFYLNYISLVISLY